MLPRCGLVAVTRKYRNLAAACQAGEQAAAQRPKGYPAAPGSPHEDLLSEATLALLEGRDPADAVVPYRARERAFGRITCPLLEAA